MKINAGALFRTTVAFSVGWLSTSFSHGYQSSLAFCFSRILLNIIAFVSPSRLAFCPLSWLFFSEPVCHSTVLVWFIRISLYSIIHLNTSTPSGIAWRGYLYTNVFPPLRCYVSNYVFNQLVYGLEVYQRQRWKDFFSRSPPVPCKPAWPAHCHSSSKIIIQHEPNGSVHLREAKPASMPPSLPNYVSFGPSKVTVSLNIATGRPA